MALTLQIIHINHVIALKNKIGLKCTPCWQRQNERWEMIFQIKFDSQICMEMSQRNSLYSYLKQTKNVIFFLLKIGE
jgi:hypothetical protein